MTHFTVSVILPEGVDADRAELEVERLLAPYDENGTAFAEGSRWDWWVVGGRWDGRMTGDGIETARDCHICAEAGKGAVATAPNPSCFWCGGTGTIREWQTNELVPSLDRNSCPGGQVAPAFVPRAYVTPDGDWHEAGRMGWWGITIEDEDGNGEKEADAWEAEWRRAVEGHAGNLFVLVDCHV